MTAEVYRQWPARGTDSMETELSSARRSTAASSCAGAATARDRRARRRRSGSARSSCIRSRRRRCAAPALPQTGHGLPKRPWTAISGSKRGDLAPGNAPPASRAQPRRSIRRARRASRRKVARPRRRRASRSARSATAGRGAGSRPNRRCRCREEPRIGQRALERVVLARKARGECREIGVEHLQPARDRMSASAVSPRTKCSAARRFVPASVNASVPFANSKVASVIRAGRLRVRARASAGGRRSSGAGRGNIRSPAPRRSACRAGARRRRADLRHRQSAARPYAARRDSEFALASSACPRTRSTKASRYTVRSGSSGMAQDD